MLNVYCLNRVKSTRDSRDMAMVVPCLILIRTLGSSLHSTVSLSFLCLKELFKAIVKSLKKISRPKQSLGMLKVIWGLQIQSKWVSWGFPSMLDF